MFFKIILPLVTTVLLAVKASEDCYNPSENDYLGNLTVTSVNGQLRTCYSWAYFAAIGKYDYIKNENFPDGSIDAAENFCRNPNGTRAQPWCFYWPNGTDYLWSYCDIPQCPSNSSSTPALKPETNDCYTKGENTYVGNVSVVPINKINRTCYTWAYIAALGKFDYMLNENFPDGSINAAGSNCRNPNDREQPWCFYWPNGTDYLWGYCDIPLCGSNSSTAMPTNPPVTSGAATKAPTKAFTNIFTTPEVHPSSKSPNVSNLCPNGKRSLDITVKNLKDAVGALGYYPQDEVYLRAMRDMLNCNFNGMNYAMVAAAQFAHESGGFIHCDEINPGWDYNSGTAGGIPGKSYHGRGPIQLSWDYNYRDASLAIFGDASVLLQNPDLVCQKLDVAAATALWYWNTRVATSSGVPEFFGESTKAINGGLEDGTCKGHRDQSDKRYKFYLEFIKQCPVEKASSKCARDMIHYCSLC